MSDIYLVPRDELYHYGVKGMKWGVRRAARKAGKAAYKETLSSTSRIGNSHYSRTRKAKRAGRKAYKETYKAEMDKQKTSSKDTANKRKQTIRYGASLAATALAMYGYYKVSQFNNYGKVSIGRDFIEKTPINSIPINPMDAFSKYNGDLGYFY